MLPLSHQNVFFDIIDVFISIEMHFNSIDGSWKEKAKTFWQLIKDLKENYVEHDLIDIDYTHHLKLMTFVLKFPVLMMTRADVAGKCHALSKSLTRLTVMISHVRGFFFWSPSSWKNYFFNIFFNQLKSVTNISSTKSPLPL